MNLEQKTALLQVINDNLHHLKNILTVVSQKMVRFSPKELSRIMAALRLLAEKLPSQIQLLEAEVGLQGILAKDIQRKFIQLFAAIPTKDLQKIRKATEELILPLSLFVTDYEHRLSTRISTSSQIRAA